MKYEMNYNPARKIWVIWEICGCNAQVVKTFKTQAGATSWLAKHS